MANFTLTLTGDKELDRALAQLEPKASKKILRKAMRAGLKIVQQQAKQNAPVETGELKRNIKVRAGQRSRTSLNLDLEVGDKGMDNYYPRMVEHGTRKMAPRAYMRRAFDETEAKAKRIVLEESKKIIESEAGGKR